MPGEEKAAPREPEGEKVPAIDRFLAVMSGKGGVGKSSVTALLAAGLQKKGLAVGVLDADITGPSIPKVMGVRGQITVENGKMVPPLSAGGIRVMSANLLLDREDDALIWRGPLVSNAIRQFWEDTDWGKLDYLLLDLPPGTSDAPLTIMQMLTETDVLIVTSPQVLASMVVRKAINMARKVGGRIIGVVENMGTALCPHCGKTFELFGGEGTEQMIRDMGLPLLGKIPHDQRISELCDIGAIETYESEAVNAMVASILAVTGHED
ncbi:MAG: Mrp/NBP35 family ATP-binding protein [Actinomycetota bacterium]|nr:Mrp/NBP35 family ATP-binding protein [Actinomycetota bacterium]